jgi:alpha-beta hydrolase superfamily lysophospholipase
LRGELVRTFTEDGLEIQGLFCPPAATNTNGIALLHIHGFTGNFYEPRFVDYIAKQVVERGCAFLTVNTRGHDYLSGFIRKTDSGLTYARIGSAYELFEECIFDIKAWIDFLQRRGYSRVILEGESLGPLKTVFYMNQTQDVRVQGLVLISPVDGIGLQRIAIGDKHDEAIKFARQMIENGKSDELMPTAYCPLWQFSISAKTYISAFGPNTKIGIFNLHDPNARFEELSTIKCPMLVTYGTIEEAVVDNKVEEALSIIKQKATSSKRCDTAIIRDAPHDYLGKEEELSGTIGNWIAAMRACAIQN